MDLKCYVFPGWTPRIRAAEVKRTWMDEAAESFPYRCLPLSIANGHGWDILTPYGFEVEWNGGPAVDDVVVRPDSGTSPHDMPVALFGLGVFTVHIQGLFRTPPGWNLYVSGPPNQAKDGVAPLSGIIETDWSPYTFTMNWRLTRPGHPVRFERDEPIAHIFPVERNAIERFEPRVVPIEEAPELKAAFEAWSKSRDAFQEQVRQHPPEKPADKWQKLYYRGLTPNGRCPVHDHQAKVRVKEFAGAVPLGPVAPAAAPIAAPTADPDRDWTMAKYEWLFEVTERQRALSQAASGIYRVRDLTSDEFLDNFYASGRPVILCGAIDHWPALSKWKPAYLRDCVGNAEIEYQGGRDGNARFELDKDQHRRRMPFDAFIDRVAEHEGNDLYLTAYNSAGNTEALAPLQADLGTVDGVLNHRASEAAGMIWIGPAGTFTPLHHDLTNNLLVQITGRKRVILASPAETPKLHNRTHVFSDVGDLTAVDPVRFPKAQGVRMLDVVLEPGEALFLPIGWWHQVEALDFSISMTYTNFIWPNLGHAEHPTRG